MKIYIMTDMEGISGVRNEAQTEPGTPAFEAARPLLCADVNAAIAGAFDGGAKEVLVNDGHGGGASFLLDRMDSRARYERPDSGRNYLPGLDETFGGVFIVGAHAMAGTLNAFLDHTQSSTTWFNYYINNRKCGEIGQVGAIAGHYGVPVLLVTGDVKACAEARDFFGDIDTVAVKEAIGRSFARCIHPEKTADMIRKAAKRAMGRVGKIKPWTLKLPIEIKLEVTRSNYADNLAKNEGVEREDARTVRKLVRNARDILWL